MIQLPDNFRGGVDFAGKTFAGNVLRESFFQIRGSRVGFDAKLRENYSKFQIGL